MDTLFSRDFWVFKRTQRFCEEPQSSKSLHLAFARPLLQPLLGHEITELLDLQMCSRLDLASGRIWGVLPSRKSWYLVLTLHVPSHGTITTIKYSCQVQMLPEPSKMTPNMFILNDSFTKSSLLQLFACPGKVSCEGGCTGLQAQESEYYACNEPHRTTMEQLDIFYDVQEFILQFIPLEPTSYHVRVFECQIEFI